MSQFVVDIASGFVAGFILVESARQIVVERRLRKQYEDLLIARQRRQEQDLWLARRQQEERAREASAAIDLALLDRAAPRVLEDRPAVLDELAAAGEARWQGLPQVQADRPATRRALAIGGLPDPAQPREPPRRPIPELPLGEVVK